MKVWNTITFDCYGTLVDWEAGISGAFREAAAAEGIEVNAADVIASYHEVEPAVQAGPYRPYREILNETAMRVAARLGWELTAERAGFLAESLPDWPVFEDTRPGLELLKQRFRLAILSNIDDDLLQGTIRRIGVQFDWTVTAQQTRSYKPTHGHFLEALDRVEGGRRGLLHAAQSWFHDIRPASELEIDSVWVNRGSNALGEGGKPLRVVHDLAELADWLVDGRQ